ncbi:MAG: NAD(P)-binding domain-containing protein [Candidatus Dormibacteraeota bacterium]|nr:NAD(P)-binding domain-containing protein [Candidatus Dormibacteraeota bacterium]
MNIGVLGTGMVGSSIATKLLQLGHSVRMGARAAGNEKAVAWAAQVGAASQGSFADAAAHGEVVFNCTAGATTLDSLLAAGAANLEGKLLLDLTNALDFSRGMPPTLTVCNEDSLGEQIQREFPSARVVKTLNTMNHLVMVDPSRVPGDHVVFLSGEDASAKSEATELLESFGWPRWRIVDLGGIVTARGAEMFVLHWVAMRQALQTGDFNIAIART